MRRAEEFGFLWSERSGPIDIAGGVQGLKSRRNIEAEGLVVQNSISLR